MTGIIDFRAALPLPRCMEVVTSPPQELEAAVGRYVEKYHISASAEELSMSPAELVRRLDRHGIDHMVVNGLGVGFDEVADYVKSEPGRLSAIASLSASGGIVDSVREIRRCYELGFRMIGLRPFLDGFRSSDRRYYPLYATCVDLGMAAVIHTSFNFGRGLKLDFGRPIHLDEVATDFPELIIIASHAGWPWVPEMVAVAWHHENIYLELSGQPARHMAKDGSGWETLFNYGSGPLKSRLLWGSGTPALDLERQLSETRDLPLGKEALSMMLDTNPRELLCRLGVEVRHSSRT